MIWGEPLERRLLLHAFVSNGVLIMQQASPGALVNDTFIVSYDPATFEVLMNHQGSDAHPGARTSIALFSSIRIECGPGDDVVVVQGTGNRPIAINCGDGNDSITLQNTDNNLASVEGGAGNDSVTGGGEADSIRGGDGVDSLAGGGGNDTLYGDQFILSGPGFDDRLDGGAGADTLYPGLGNDTAFGGPGNDYVSDGGGNNLLFGDEDADQIFGGPDTSYISGGDGNDSLYGDAQSDTLFGGPGNDLLAGFAGEDWMYANDAQRDTVNGGDGADWADVDAQDVIVDAEERIGVQTAYNGAAWPLPTLIQAENFDFGGEGAAYHDNDFNLATSGYRGKTSVDLGSTLISFFPPIVLTHVVGDAGEWLEYTVDVPATGGYEIRTAVSSAGPGGTFHYEVDGVTKTPTLTVPDTSAVFGYRSVTWGGINLPAGRHVLRLALDTASATTGHVGNFESISLDAEGRQGYPAGLAPIPGTVEAENFDTGGEGVAFHDTTLANEGAAYRNTAVDVQANTDGGGGYHAAVIRAGEWLEYGVNVGRAGTYVLSARVASQGSGGTFHVNFNGVNKTAAITIPNTGTWDTWQTLTRTVTLGAGEQIMRIAMDTSGALGYVGNINWVRVMPLPGDANLDGRVSFTDWTLLERASGQPVQPWGPGDLNGDGVSNFTDIRLLLDNYGATAAPGVPADPVAGSPGSSPPRPAPIPKPAAVSRPTVRTVQRAT